MASSQLGIPIEPSRVRIQMQSTGGISRLASDPLFFVQCPLILGHIDLKKKWSGEGRRRVSKWHLVKVQVCIWFALGINHLISLIYHGEWERQS